MHLKNEGLIVTDPIDRDDKRLVPLWTVGALDDLGAAYLLAIETAQVGRV